MMSSHNMRCRQKEEGFNMTEFNKRPKRELLDFIMLCSISIILLYRWRFQMSKLRFLPLTTKQSNNLQSDEGDTRGLPQPAVDSMDVLGMTRLTNTSSEENPLNRVYQVSNRSSSGLDGKQTGVLKNVTGVLKPVHDKMVEIYHTTKSNIKSTTTPRMHPKLAKCNEYVEKRNMLCCRPVGRLGNKMFVYASAYGIATKLNRTLVIGKEMKLYHFFNLKADITDDYRCVIRGYKRRSANIDCGYDPRLFELPKGDNYCVGSFLQSYKYFDHVKEDIREQFTFRTKQREMAKTIISDAIKTFSMRTKADPSTEPVLVGVHVRRGDMVNHTFGFDVATPEYMNKSMNYFRRKYGRVLFLVCSNGMDWVKKHVAGNDVILVEGNTYDVDMAVLVSCNHTLSTVGSFSWWASYLTGGDTVYYQWPAKEGSRLRKRMNYPDYFPPAWIGMR